MFLPSSQPAVPIPVPSSSPVADGLALLPPLSRRGHGPGMLVVCPPTADPTAIVEGVPWPAVKWAEEGYAVVELQVPAVAADAAGAVAKALAALAACDACTPKDKVGLVAYGAAAWNAVAPALAGAPAVVAAAVYADAGEQDALAPAAIPVQQHLAGKAASGRLLERPAGGSSGSSGPVRYFYPAKTSYQFAVPFQPAFDYATEAVSHTRNLSFLKPAIGGPYFDLEVIWEEHTFYEFDDRSVEHTMSTMVQEPYVNHIPTLTGGIGRPKLTAFYRDHFIFNNSGDTGMDLISRTIGIDRVVDEFIMTFTHDTVVDWMLPGIPPTHKPVQAPFTAIVNIRGDRLYHEHIAWDQGTVLAQLGLLPDYLPYPYPVPAGAPGLPAGGVAGKNYVYRLPVAGVETADKLRQKTAVESNQMFAFGVKEA